MIEPNDPSIKELLTEAVCNSQVSVVLTKSLSEGDSGGDFLQTKARFVEPKTLEEEVKRLQTLRSYLILDSEREFPFERLTALASRALNTPISLVSLVDLSRQWFMSNRGLGDVRETPRKFAFCAHAIVSEDDIFIVKDATIDPRFSDNPLVTGPPYIRFYAGAPLVSPEGYKLGTFCVIDTTPRPDGLDLNEKQNLREFSYLAVQVLVARKRKRERECETDSQLVTCIAHDLLTPLSGIELGLTLLNDDAELQNRLTVEQRKGVHKAVECANVLQEICRNVRSTLVDTKSSFDLTRMGSQLHSFSIDKMVERIYLVIDSLEKRVPVQIIIDPDVPHQIVSDDAKIFRCAMNYLVVACARTKIGMISLRFRTRKDPHNEKPVLFVTCEDTAAPVDRDAYPYLFKPVTSRGSLFPDGPVRTRRLKDRSSNLELALFSVAREMNSIGGEYGFHPRSPEHGLVIDDHYEGEIGSNFWFSLSYSIPEVKSQLVPILHQKDTTQNISREMAVQFHEAVMEASLAPAIKIENSSPMDSPSIRNEVVQSSSVETNTNTTKRTKKALVIEDSAVVLKMLTRSLTKLGFEVTQAENGMEGLHELKISLYDLTLCDFLMPVMDGLDCVQQYREWEKVHRPWFTQRIIGISAHASKVDVDKGLQLGMNGYKDKPVSLKDLQELITTKEQQEMFTLLDKIEEHEIGSFNTSITLDSKELDDCDSQTIMKADEKISVASPGFHRSRALACLVLTPLSTETHDKRVQDAIRQVGWQCASVHSDSDGWNLLKMRTWDIILADEIFAPTIDKFRMWEIKCRPQRRSNVIVITERLTPGASDTKIDAPGFDEAIGKPLGLNALRCLLHRKADELDRIMT